MAGTAGCGPVNPLAEIAKHAQRDRSLQQDRLQQGAHLARRDMRDSKTVVALSEQEDVVNQVFQNSGSSRYNYSGMKREINRLSYGERAIHHSTTQEPSISTSSLTKVNPVSMVQPRYNWKKEFTSQFALPDERYQPSYIPYHNHSIFANNMPIYSPQDVTMSGLHQHLVVGKGKEKITELDDKNWEEEFAAFDDGANRSASPTHSQINEAMKPEIESQDDNFYGDFESIWRGINADQVYGNSSDVDLYNEPFLEQKVPVLGIDGKPNLGTYLFEPNNPFLEHEDPLNLGKQVLSKGATRNLSGAVLAFEAAVQRDPTNVEGWLLLGQTQAQDEKELAAIRALEQVLQLDSANLGALMNLAISYTNEGYDTSAYITLSHWLANKYPDIAVPFNYNGQSQKEIHDQVTQGFIKAAQRAPIGENMDPDVQVGLGVLFYGDEEYDKAVDCFEAALQRRPDDPLMWNRLGATLANSGRSEEAISSYHKALHLYPTFVRARYNLGVSCINIGCYNEAAQHLLGALSLHDEKGVNISFNLWETLGRVLMCLDRRDLLDAVKDRNVATIIEGLGLKEQC